MFYSKIITEGIVIECLPNSTFLILTKNNNKVLCHLSGKMRINYIRIIRGDKVRIEFYRNNTTKGRIIYRLK
ncbi:translation initiation factor IF-1 [Candidatus Vidania fulgoroideae]|uniref:Translation initiation factor IF-1 n=1 Tax=Candidatus Vidania fulgoroideorum TaxID=881286 RepID=A0A974X7V8_9PROT|nr:translation initiation factor IF-1 [Candidatus Vidania fulgoroideae]